MAIRQRISNPLGVRVTALREKKGLTKSALAKEVGVSTTCIWNWEEGNTTPRHESLQALALALETTKEYLITGIEEYSGEPATESVYLEKSIKVDDVIREARTKIAMAAGINVSQVTVQLTYSD